MAPAVWPQCQRRSLQPWGDVGGGGGGGSTGLRGCSLSPFGSCLLGRGALADQGHVIDHADGLIQANGQGGQVCDPGGLDPVQVLDHGATDAVESRLLRARQPFIGGLQGRHQGFGATGQSRLLGGHAQGGLDVDQQILVPGARHGLDQVLDLGALQGDFGQTCFEQRGAGGGLASDFLGLFGQHLGLLREDLAVLLALDQL